MADNHEKIIIAEFVKRVDTASSLKDLENIDDFIKENKEKLLLLRAIAYKYLLYQVGKDDAKDSELAFAYFMMGQTQDKAHWRFLYFNIAWDYFREAEFHFGTESSSLFLSSKELNGYASFKIDLHQAVFGDDENG